MNDFGSFDQVEDTAIVDNVAVWQIDLHVESETFKNLDLGHDHDVLP